MFLNRRHIFPILIGAVLLFLAIGTVSFIPKYLEFKKQVKALIINEVDLSTVRDGVYEGECDLVIVDIRVEVTVQNKRIEGIKLLNDQPEKKFSAEPLIAGVVEKQSTKVDGIAGATGTSKAFLKAVEVALKQSLN